MRPYTVGSIDALKHLRQVPKDAIATVASYAEPGDRGGGDFTFVGVPGSANVVSATAVSTPITAVTTSADGLVTITTATAHNLGLPYNITTVFIEGVAGLADRPYVITVASGSRSVDSFTINERVAGAGFAAGAAIHRVDLVTAAPHGRATGQRVSVGGVVPSSGAVDVRGVCDTSGVITPTTLSVPVKATGGTYTTGVCAVIGDDGLSVPAVDAGGTYGGVWQRLRAEHFDVRWLSPSGLTRRSPPVAGQAPC